MHSANFVIQSERELVRVSGADRLTFLQSKLTANTKRWRTTGGSYAIGVNINGKVLFDAHCFARADGTVWMSFAPGFAAKTVEFLDRYVIMEDVVFENISEAWTCISVFGPEAHAAVGGAPDGYHLAEWSEDERCQICSPQTWLPEGGAVIFAPIAALPEVAGRLERAGARKMTEAQLATAQVAAGVPVIGRDVSVDETIPLEAGLWTGVDFNKGCYLGQEVIERLFSRGSPNKRLMRIRWNGGPVEARTPIHAGDKAAGWVTSSVAGAAGEAIGMGYVRRKYLDGQTPLLIEESPISMIGYVGGERPS